MIHLHKTLDKLRSRGYTADLAHPEKLFGFANVVAASPERGELLLILSTVGRLNDDNRPWAVEVLQWLQCGGRAEIWEWAHEEVVRTPLTVRDLAGSLNTTNAN